MIQSYNDSLLEAYKAIISGFFNVFNKVDPDSWKTIKQTYCSLSDEWEEVVWKQNIDNDTTQIRFPFLIMTPDNLDRTIDYSHLSMKPYQLNVAELDGSQSYWMLPISQTLKFTIYSNSYRSLLEYLIQYLFIKTNLNSIKYTSEQFRPDQIFELTLQMLDLPTIQKAKLNEKINNKGQIYSMSFQGKAIIPVFSKVDVPVLIKRAIANYIYAGAENNVLLESQIIGNKLENSIMEDNLETSPIEDNSENSITGEQNA
jgi:hypothetical protein